VLAVPLWAGEQLWDRHPKLPRPDLASPHGVRPRRGAKVKLLPTLSISVTLIVVTLNLRPIELPPPIWKQRRRHMQLAALYRLDPSRVTKSKAAGAFDKTVPLVMISLHGVPIVKFSWHTTILETRCANRMALKQCFRQVAALLTPN
jgi:hypothetical protein